MVVASGSVMVDAMTDHKHAAGQDRRPPGGCAVKPSGSSVFSFPLCKHPTIDLTLRHELALCPKPIVIGSSRCLPFPFPPKICRHGYLLRVDAVPPVIVDGDRVRALCPSFRPVARRSSGRVRCRLRCRAVHWGVSGICCVLSHVQPFRHVPFFQRRADIAISHSLRILTLNVAALIIDSNFQAEEYSSYRIIARKGL